MTALYVGLMSGTSMDGIDAALVDCYSVEPHLVATHSKAWPDVIRQQLLHAHQPDDDAIFHLNELDRAIAEQFAHATLNLLAIANAEADEIVAIGSHGQTIRHRPHAEPPYSPQLGNGNIPVESTEQHGTHPDWVEATAFAWLAQHHIEGRPGNLPSVTGATKAFVPGTLSAPDI